MKTEQHLKEAIDRYKGGDKDSFRIIYDDTYKYLHTCVIHIVKDEDMAQDMIQETYLEICRNILQLNDPEVFYGWAATIANRKCFALMKKQKDFILYDDQQDNEDSEGSSSIDNIADDEQFIPESILQDQEKQRLMKDIIDGLPDVQRMCIIGFYYNEQKQEDIAAELGIPVNTVKTHLSRARKKVKEAVIDLDKNKKTRLYSLTPFMLLFFAKEASACELVPMSESLESAVFGDAAVKAETITEVPHTANSISRIKFIASIAGVVCIGTAAAIIVSLNHHTADTASQNSVTSQYTAAAEETMTEKETVSSVTAASANEAAAETSTTVSEPEAEKVQTFAEMNGITFTDEKSFTMPWAIEFTNGEHTEKQDYSGVSVKQEDATITINSVSSEPSEKAGYKDIKMSCESDFPYDITLDYENYDDEQHFYWSYSVPMIGCMDLYTGNEYLSSDCSVNTPEFSKNFEIDFNDKKYDICYKKQFTTDNNGGDWETVDDTHDRKNYKGVMKADCVITVPDDYDGLAFYISKAGEDKVSLQDKNNDKLHSILVSDDGTKTYSIDDFYFIKPE